MSNSADPVNRPAHYTSGKIEVIDFLEDQQFGPHLFNVVKYVSRAKHKGTELQDLRKAEWYLKRYIALRERELGEVSAAPTEQERAINDGRLALSGWGR